MTSNTVGCMISSLRTAAKVPVFVGERTQPNTDSILISELRANVIAGVYAKLYAFTHKAWRNIPDAPGCEPPYVIMWMLACEDYDVNHNTIEWPGAGPNTFVHIWSMIERLRTTFTEAGVEWVMGPRDAVGYCTSMNITGPTDTHIYAGERILLPQVAAMSRGMKACRRTDVTRDFVSFFDMETSMMLPGTGWRTRP
jgi:hypothetical protein